MAVMRQCQTCRDDLPDTSFSPSVLKRRPVGQCKDCVNLRSKEWYQENKAHSKRTQLRVKFGLSLEEFQRLKSAQGGVCAVCLQPPHVKRKGVVKELAVDHDHATGKVRGLLCQHCNLAMGQFQDDPELLAAALVYLRRCRP